MKTIFRVVLCYVYLLFFVSFELSDASTKQSEHRQRRYLSFRNISHFFANMVPWNQIFAQALGFRMNWNDPPDSFHPYHHLYRRTVYSHVETLLDRNGLEGFHCIRRAICEMNRISKPKGIYHKILKIIFSQKSSATDKWHNGSEQDCSFSVRSCPFSMLEVSTYTDT